MADLQHQLLSIRHVTVPQLLTAAAVVAGLLLIALLMQRAFQQQVCPSLCSPSSTAFCALKSHTYLVSRQIATSYIRDSRASVLLYVML